MLEGVAAHSSRGHSRPGIGPASQALALADRFFTTGPTWEASVALQSHLLRIASLQIMF